MIKHSNCSHQTKKLLSNLTNEETLLGGIKDECRERISRMVSLDCELVSLHVSLAKCTLIYHHLHEIVMHNMKMREHLYINSWNP